MKNKSAGDTKTLWEISERKTKSLSNRVQGGGGEMLKNSSTLSPRLNPT